MRWKKRIAVHTGEKSGVMVEFLNCKEYINSNLFINFGDSTGWEMMMANVNAAYATRNLIGNHN